MILFREAFALTKYINYLKGKNLRVGLVPTMGALHDGHISLLDMAKQSADIDIAISSIFVNPTQFNDLKDFRKYPVTLSNDLLKLENAGCDILFLPSAEEMYPDGTGNLQQYNLGNLEVLLEGFYRPGHFQGVCQAVKRLLDIVKPEQLFMGQKDYQQCLVIQKMIDDLSLSVQLKISPTLREPSGLAMSSRNMRLSNEERKTASAIFNTLQHIRKNFSTMSLGPLTESSGAFLLQSGFSKIDYVSIADAKTLEPVKVWDSSTPLVALIAAFLGEVRLIDNLVLTVPDQALLKTPVGAVTAN